MPALARRLRAASGGRYHAPGTPPAVAQGEMLVHSADALRPLGLSLDSPPETAAPLLDVYWRMGRLAFHGAPLRRVRLVATDLDWSRGNGPEVSGRAVDLLLLMANRRQVIATLGGPGLPVLSR